MLQRNPVARAHLLVFGQVVNDLYPLKVRRQRLSLAALSFVGGYRNRFGLGLWDPLELGFVEQPQLGR